jgi:hypothetical protein
LCRLKLTLLPVDCRHLSLMPCPSLKPLESLIKRVITM